MPMISLRDQRQREQESLYQLEPDPIEASFGEVFRASLGSAVDEELSISNTLNRQGWAERRETVQQLIDSGQLDKDQYWTRQKGQGYRFDYNAIARDYEDVKSDEELNEERNAILAQRRERSQDVIERGSGMAQFLGAMTAYMLDPISLATLPISTATTASKGIASIGRTAAKFGALEGVAELGIQGFVFEHKADIESPYSWQEALTNIATAATGAAAIGGGAKGIGDYLRLVLDKAKGLPQTGDVDTAVSNLRRMIDTVDSNPNRTKDMTAEQAVQSDKDWLTELEMNRASYNKQIKDPQAYAPRETKIDGSGLASREKAVLEAKGMADEYNQDMLKFRQLAGERGKRLFELEQDFAGIKIKGKDASTVWRQAVKRREALDTLENCLSGSTADECLDKLGKAFNKKEGDEILERIQALTGKGMSEQEASLGAIREAKEVADKQLTEIVDQAEEAGATVTRPEAETEQIPLVRPTDDGAEVVDARKLVNDFDDAIEAMDDIIRCSVSG